MASKTLQVRKVGLNAGLAFVLLSDLQIHPSCNRVVNGGFDDFERVCLCRHTFDHGLREKAPFAALKKRFDALSRATCRLGDGLACQRPYDVWIGMLAKDSVKSIIGVLYAHWLLLRRGRKGFQAATLRTAWRRPPPSLQETRSGSVR